MNEQWNNTVRLARTSQLYARVGLARMTLPKAYQMARYWLLTTILKKRVPWLIELSVTYLCNCTCKHCSVSNYFPEANKNKELTTEQVKSIVNQARAMGIPKVDYFGGEPLIRKDILELVEYGERQGLYISLTTNAWFLDREMVRKLKRAGISCINVSLDSVDEEEHDRLRGLKGIYQRAVNAVRFCHEEGVPCIVSTYATRRRIVNFAKDHDDSLLTAIVQMARELKATGIRILFPIISGEWVKRKEIELTEEEKRWVIDHIDPSFAFIEGAYSVVKRKKVCQALSGRIINISPYGDMQLCVAFPNTFGNVNNEGLEPLIRKMWAHPIYQKNKDTGCCSTLDLKV